MRVFCWFLAVVLLTFSVAAQVSLPDKSLPNFAQVNPRLFRGAQPEDNGFALLAKLGVKTVVDLRGADNRAAREEKLVRAAGMNFINVPLKNWSRPKDESVANILKIITAPENQPVFIHCKRGADRTGTIVAVYRISVDGWDAKRANKEAAEYGFGWWQFWMKDFINDYYRDKK